MSTAFDAFVTVHQYQLASIPKELWQVKYTVQKDNSSSTFTKRDFIILASFYETRRRLPRCR